MAFHRAFAFRAIVVALWAVAGLDLTPVIHLSAAADLYLVAAACVGSYAWIARANARPVDEVFEAGVAVGRRQVECEQASQDVVRLADRRAPGLRAVSD